MRLLRTVLIIMVVYALALQAQESHPVFHRPSSDTTAVAIIGFDRSLETFLWNERLTVAGQFANAAAVMDQRFRSRVIKVGRTLVQDDFRLSFAGAIPVGSRWGVKADIASTVVSDNSQTDLGSLSQHRLLAGPEFIPTDGTVFFALAGFETASQQGVSDDGPALALGFAASPVRLDEFDVSAFSRLGRSWLAPRTLEVDSARLYVTRAFSDAASNALGLLYARQGREFYVPADDDVARDFQRSTNIFQRTSTEAAIADTLTVSAGSTSLKFHGGLSSRRIDRSYRFKSFSNPAGVLLDVVIREHRLAGGGTARLEPADWFAVSAMMEFEEREERHRVTDDPGVPRQTFDRQDQAARRLTNIARRSSVGMSARAILGEKDVLNLSGSASILRYDTPDSLNVDDRDELLILLAVGETHRFSERLTLSVAADITLSHLVYLNRFQSANNAWNRIIRFRPRAVYSPFPWLVTVNSAEVLANYTVYDFEEQLQSVRSFSFRQAVWTDSTWIRAGASTEFLFEGSVRVYERGILRWREFSERPENYFVELALWPRFFVGATDHLRMSLGFRYFSQSRFRYRGRNREFERRLRSSGPTVSIQWRGIRGGTVDMEGWRETQTDDAGSTRSYSNLLLIVGMAL